MLLFQSLTNAELSMLAQKLNRSGHHAFLVAHIIAEGCQIIDYRDDEWWQSREKWRDIMDESFELMREVDEYGASLRAREKVNFWGRKFIRPLTNKR